MLVSQHNPAMSDLASGLSGSLSRDGLGGMRNNLDMGGFKVTNLAPGSLPADAARIDQVVLSSNPETTGRFRAIGGIIGRSQNHGSEGGVIVADAVGNPNAAYLQFTDAEQTVQYGYFKANTDGSFSITGNLVHTTGATFATNGNVSGSVWAPAGNAKGYVDGIAAQMLGIGQFWTNPGWSLNTAYPNTSSRPIMVKASKFTSSPGPTNMNLRLLVSGVLVEENGMFISAAGGNNTCSVSGIVPPGQTFTFESSGPGSVVFAALT